MCFSGVNWRQACADRIRRSDEDTSGCVFEEPIGEMDEEPMRRDNILIVE